MERLIIGIGFYILRNSIERVLGKVDEYWSRIRELSEFQEWFEKGGQK